MSNPWTPQPNPINVWMPEAGVGAWSYYDGSFNYDGSRLYGGTQDPPTQWTIQPNPINVWTPR